MGHAPYRMQLSLNVLEHLGINLYSNVPSVLSEAVANSWDADAETVAIRFQNDKDTIVIQDDGIGMTREQVNQRFLLVGYRRRDAQPGPTTKGRAPMGRKGIGKLSLFSIANEIIVETIRDEERSAFRMKLEDIRDAIRDGRGTYEPEALDVSPIDFETGTRLTLRQVKKRQTISTVEGLRKRLARRFSIIGPANDFEIIVNDRPIVPEDRGYYDKLQYIWTYGDRSSTFRLCSRIEKSGVRANRFGDPSMTITGWLGTVFESKQLKDDFGENLNRIAIFVRGKIAQEDMLSDFTERGVYASYIIGELRIDDLDRDEEEDSATSSRQKIVEDDSRYIALKTFLATELKYLQGQWSELRKEAGVKSALKIPEVKAWIDNLPKNYASQAKTWLGRIHRINVDDINERRHLIKHAVLAFEFYRWNYDIDKLEEIRDVDLDTAIGMFRQLDSLEANLYGQIVQQRIAVIRTLRDKVEDNAREAAIQKYIFDHLWLLDPSWERVEASEHMETQVGKLFVQIEADLTDEERAGRIDIQYRKTAGQHVIIELKRPDRIVSVHDLGKQIGKYRSGMLKILSESGIPHEPVEFVCLLGRPPREWADEGGKKVVRDVLAAQGARYVNYSELLENAFQAYGDYFRRGKALGPLDAVIRAIEDYEE